MNSLNSLDLGYEFIIENKEVTFEEIKEKIENNEIEDAIIIDKVSDKIQMTYIVEDATMMTEVPESLRNTFTNLYTNLQLTKLNLSEEQLASLSPEFEFDLKQTEEQEVKGNVFAIMLFIISIVLCYLFLCLSSISFYYNRKRLQRLWRHWLLQQNLEPLYLEKRLVLELLVLFKFL